MNAQLPQLRPQKGAGLKIPQLFGLLLRLVLPEEEREFFLGDLEEGRNRSWGRELLGALVLRFSPNPNPNPNPNKKQTHRGDSVFQELLFDLKYALRSLLRSPAFAAVALITMALGIGANTAMFSIVDGVLLRPLPYPEADRIVLLRENNLPRGWESFSIAPLNLWDWEEQNRSLELISAYQTGLVNYTGGDRPESLSAYRVTEDFLPILGGAPARGRGIVEEDLDPDGPGVVVLSHGFWQRAFGGDPEIIGKTMRLDDVNHTIVGVLPEDWRGFSSDQAEVFLPLKPQPFWYTNRGNHFLRGLGRLRDGVTVEQARADLNAIASALQTEYPDTNEGWGAVVNPLGEAVLGSTGPQLLIFMASVGLILLMACANLMNMTLARGASRMRELAIRTAVGAGRARIVRQLLVESVFLSLLGGALGVALANLGLKAFVTGWPTLLPRMQEIELSSTVLLFSLALSLGSGVLFGLVPAVGMASSSLAESLREGARNLAGTRSRRWARTGLVAAEMGLAVVLLVGTGLLVRSFSALQGEDTGFRLENRLVLSTPLPGAKYPTNEERQAFADQGLSRLAAIPGVDAVAYTSLLPLGRSDEIWGFWREENARPGASEDGSALSYRVSPGYFGTMGIPILAGRDIGPDDAPEGQPVVVISRAMAEQIFPGEDPVGKRITFGRNADDLPVEIVGVVGDVQHYHVGESSIPQLYVPFAQWPTGGLSWVIHAGIPPLGLMEGVREAVGAVDPDQPLVDFQEAGSLFSDSISLPRFRTLLMTGFGLTALLLAVVGLYGVVAFRVSQRTKEIGVRMALGATRGSVLKLILREGIPLVGVGVAVGLAGSLALSRVMGSMLFGVGSRDPVVFLGVPMVLALVAVAALLIPARRAAGVDPVRTLGEE